MPSTQLPYETQKRIYDLANGHDKPSARKIAAQLGIHHATVLRYAHTPPVRPVAEPEIIPDLHAKIKASLRKQPMSDLELADALDCGPSKIREAISVLRAANLNIVPREDGKWDMHGDIPTGGKTEAIIPDRGDGWQVFGYTADNHLCNKNARLDVLNNLYDIFAEEGITKVYNGGNMVDGEARFNRNDLLVFGMDRQLDYLVEHFPQRNNIVTEFITGDDHCGWWAQRECINIGEHIQDRFERAGRKDFRYLSNVEHDIALKHGTGEAVLRIMHPGGGSAYAYSYTSQKIVESFQGGEKPAILLSSHYHKMDYCIPRNVHVIQMGTTEDQTTFMRKKKLEAHVGGGIVWFKQDEHGSITRLRNEYIPFFDRKYYQRSFE